MRWCDVARFDVSAAGTDCVLFITDYRITQRPCEVYLRGVTAGRHI